MGVDPFQIAKWVDLHFGREYILTVRPELRNDWPEILEQNPSVNLRVRSRINQKECIFTALHTVKFTMNISSEGFALK